MAKYRLKPLWAKIFGIALAVILVASIIGIVIICIAPWKWLAIPGLAGLTYFAAEPVVVLEKKLIARAKREDVEQV